MVFVTESRETKPSTFIVARVLRIVPLYWLFTIGAALALAAAPGLYHANELSFRHLVLSLLFVPHMISVSMQPLLKAGWTLNYEMFFYAVFTGAMAISRRHRVLIVSTTLALLALGGYAFHFANPHYRIVSDDNLLFFAWYYTADVILEFVCGMLLATLYLHSAAVNIPRWLLAFGIAVSVTWMFVIMPSSEAAPRFIAWGVPAAAIVRCLLWWEKSWHGRQSAVLLLLGDASYSLYLSHMLPLALLRWGWNHFHLPAYGLALAILFSVLGIATATAFGIAVYRLLEKPLFDWSHQLRRRLAPSEQSAL